MSPKMTPIMKDPTKMPTNSPKDFRTATKSMPLALSLDGEYALTDLHKSTRRQCFEHSASSLPFLRLFCSSVKVLISIVRSIVKQLSCMHAPGRPGREGGGGGWQGVFFQIQVSRDHLRIIIYITIGKTVYVRQTS